MSESTEVAELETGGGAVVVAAPSAVAPHGGGHAHPAPRQYVLIAVVLVVITALEVAVSYLDRDAMGPNLIILMLGIMAMTKFFLVVSWYMHLKTDAPILRRFFLVGLIGAPVLYLVIALTFKAFSGSYNVTP